MRRATLVVGCVWLLIAGAVMPAQAQLRTEVVAQGLSSPVAFIPDPTSPTRFFIVQQGGLIRLLENGVRCRRSSTCGRRSSWRAASRGCSAWPSRQMPPPAGASSSTSPARPATSWSRAFVVLRRMRPRRIRRRASTWCGPVACPTSHTRGTATTTEATWRSGPTGTSTSARVMAVAVTIPTTTRRTRSRCSARCSAST